MKSTRKEVIAPAEVPRPRFPCSPAIRAGPWVFVAGQLASDYKTGVPAEVRVDQNWPYNVSQTKRETEYIFKNLKTTLEAAGTSLDNVVRIDQFFTPKALVMGSTARSVTDFLEVREKWLPKPQPASTGLEVSRLLVPDTNLEADLIAIIPSEKMLKKGIVCDKVPMPVAGYSQAIRAGQYVFLAGDVASNWKHVIAPEASVDESFWYGSHIKQQAEYTLNKMKTVLEEAGSSLSNVVKANVYLTDIRDLYGLEEVWKRYFPVEPPARTIVPINRLGGEGWRVEINMIAVIPNENVQKEVVTTEMAPKSVMHESQAIKAGPLLFLSGQMAVNETGLAPEVALDPSFPYFGISIKRQMEYVIKNMKVICEAAGTSLQNVVKTQHFHLDLREFAASMEVWGSAFIDPPASSIVEIKGPLAATGCTILVDAIAIIPEEL